MSGPAEAAHRAGAAVRGAATATRPQAPPALGPSQPTRRCFRRSSSLRPRGRFPRFPRRRILGRNVRPPPPDRRPAGSASNQPRTCRRLALQALPAPARRHHLRPRRRRRRRRRRRAAGSQATPRSSVPGQSMQLAPAAARARQAGRAAPDPPPGPGPAAGATRLQAKGRVSHERTAYKQREERPPAGQGFVWGRESSHPQRQG